MHPGYRIDDAALGDECRHERRRRDVEHGVAQGDAGLAVDGGMSSMLMDMVPRPGFNKTA